MRVADLNYTQQFDRQFVTVCDVSYHNSPSVAEFVYPKKILETQQLSDGFVRVWSRPEKGHRLLLIPVC